eukprot:9377296-Pyramimonas_sp.AAC.1
MPAPAPGPGSLEKPDRLISIRGGAEIREDDASMGALPINLREVAGGEAGLFGPPPHRSPWEGRHPAPGKSRPF